MIEKEDVFNNVVDFLFKLEGFYSNDLDDIGGETVYGISKKYHPEWEGWKYLKECKEKGWTVDMERLKGMAKRFYYENYYKDYVIESGNWNEVRFLCAVNIGKNAEKRIYEKSGKSFFDYIVNMVDYYIKISYKGKNIKFLRGWIRRIIKIYWWMRGKEK